MRQAGDCRGEDGEHGARDGVEVGVGRSAQGWTAEGRPWSRPWVGLGVWVVLHPQIQACDVVHGGPGAVEEGARVGNARGQLVRDARGPWTCGGGQRGRGTHRGLVGWWVP